MCWGGGDGDGGWVGGWVCMWAAVGGWVGAHWGGGDGSTSTIKSREKGCSVHSGQDAPERFEPARASTHRVRKQPDCGLGPWVQHQLPGLSYSSAPEAASDGRPRGCNSLDIGAEDFVCVGG